MKKLYIQVLILLLFAAIQLSAQTFTFDTDTEGWTTNADGSAAVWEPFGGNPGGYISAFDISTGGTWHWVAPSFMLGNVCGAYGLTLSFDLFTSVQQTNNTKPDVILSGNGMILVFNTAFDPNTFWTNYDVTMKEDAGWRIGAVNGPIPTKQQFVDVLLNLDGLQIRGEYLQNNIDNGGLDNVVLSSTSFELDLDKNDSTTPPGSKDFVNDTSCTDGATMCDVDLGLLSESPIDSIVVQLITTFDGSNESLSFPLPAPALSPSVTGVGTQKIILGNTGQTTASFYREALKKITFANTASIATPGVRFVQVTVYTICGPLAFAYVRIPYFPPAYAGEDGTVDFCPDDPATDLVNYLGGAFTPNGSWSPGFADGSTRFDPEADTPGTFQYIVKSVWDGCPNDTSEVVVRVASPIGDLGPDTTLCYSPFIQLSLATLPEHTQWLWSSGETTASISVTTAGVYTVTVTSDINNCAFTDQISIAPTPYAGEDGTVDFCPSDPATNLANYLTGTFVPGGAWSPGFVDGSNRFDPAADTPGTYQYIVKSNWEGCPGDTATVVVRVASPIGDLGPDTTLCNSPSLQFTLVTLPEHNNWVWSTGETTAAITVNTAGLYAVTVTSSINNCIFSDQIKVEPPPYAGEDGSGDFCPDDPAIDLRSLLGGTFVQNGYWSPAFMDSGGLFDPKLDTDRKFQYIIPSNWVGCPNDTAIVEVRVASPITDFGPDTILCRDATLRLSINTLPEYNNWQWSTGSFSSSILVQTAGVYSVTVTSEVNNCVFVDSIKVDYVTCLECPVYVPNVFSPDDDGRNDKFQAFAGCDFLSYHLSIYDRWGALMFETYDPNTEWEGDFRGKNLNPGVYVWLLDYETELLGKPFARRKQGDVTIVK